MRYLLWWVLFFRFTGMAENPNTDAEYVEGSETEGDGGEEDDEEVIEVLQPVVRDGLVAQNILEVNQEPQPGIGDKAHTATGLRHRYTLKFRLWLGKEAHECKVLLSPLLCSWLSSDSSKWRIRTPIGNGIHSSPHCSAVFSNQTF